MGQVFTKLLQFWYHVKGLIWIFLFSCPVWVGAQESVKYVHAFFCYVSSHCPDLYKVALCAGKQLSVKQTLLRTHLQKKQKEKECLLIWRDRTAWGQCSGNRRGDCQPQRGNSPVLTWQEEVQTGKVHSVWGTLLSGVQGGLLQGVTGKPRTEVSYQNQGRIIGILITLSFMFK